MKYSFLFPVTCSFLLHILPASAQVAQPIAAGQSPTAPVPVQLSCRSFSGHIKSTTGTPLVGATIMVKGTYVARTTNDEGYFAFDLPAVPTQAPHLMVSSAGFGPQEFLITSCEPLNIELQILEGTRIKQRGKHKGFIKQAGKS
ncbi:carboxypeptidase-like regulatory domain-containing protein [Hymenobacter bucti]|uniref:Carboxypeptidase-like regulatory domain-containing protein n=1 Tax=Hymenobacter bucti TaxID=1844114 RepID=A0ABW4QXC3_9BACT